MAKAHLPEVRKADPEAWKAAIGRVVREVRGTYSLKEFAGLLDRDARQIARWEDGREHPQFAAILAVASLQSVCIVALAGLAENVEVITEIRVRRRA
jgi:DNA-binding transcriptional regulator YiaG